MKLKFLVMMTLLLTLSACVEFKNPDQENGQAVPAPTPVPVEPEEPVVVQTVPSLVVDQDLFLFESEILTRAQLIGKKRMPQANLKLIYPFEKIEIKQGFTLYTLGQNVRIEVKELQSKKGIIATLPEGAKAANYVNGRDGGHIELIVDKAEGELALILRGENGGVGHPAKLYDEQLRGQPGEALLTKDCDNPDAKEKWKGKKGQKGYPAGDGMKGGNSGSLYVRINNYDYLKFKFYHDQVPGVGGEPGARSVRGGERGPNGPTGCNFPKFKIPQQPEDPKFIGDPGDEGNQGDDGVKEKICEYKDGKDLCY